MATSSLGSSHSTSKVMQIRQAELDIIAHSKDKQFEKIEPIKEELKWRLGILDYIMARFLDQFGHKLASEKPETRIYHQFVERQSLRYNETTRLLNVIEVYRKLYG